MICSTLIVSTNYFQFDKNRFVFANTIDEVYIHIDPQVANSVISNLDEYTPIIEENSVDLEITLGPEENDGFVSSEDQKQFETEETQLEIEYLVQKGDTMIGIAQKFNVTVATILQRNNLPVDKIENLTTGMVLIIPPKSTSESTDWLVALNKKKEEEARKRALAAAATRRSRVLSSTTRASSGFTGVANGNFIVPIRHNGITRGISRYHTGIDYRATMGTPVVAAAEGKVIEITRGWAGGWGISIVLDHGGGLTTRYAHLSRFVSEIGQIVSQGQVIGYSGNSGYSTGPHLHFEARLNGRVVSPF